MPYAHVETWRHQWWTEQIKQQTLSRALKQKLLQGSEKDGELIQTCESSKYTAQTLKFLRFKCSTKFRSIGTCEKSSIWPINYFTVIESQKKRFSMRRDTNTIIARLNTLTTCIIVTQIKLQKSWSECCDYNCGLNCNKIWIWIDWTEFFTIKNLISLVLSYESTGASPPAIWKEC